MIKKYIFGKPFVTDSVVAFPEDGKVFEMNGDIPYGKISVSENQFNYVLPLNDGDMLFGLGEAMGGINKRGRIYRSWCNDDPVHSEEKESLYGAHNFLIYYSPAEAKCFGLYFDYPGLVVFDAGFTKKDLLSVSIEKSDLNLYLIESELNSLNDVVSQFRKMIGQSYIPPFWAFGFMQSRWGYGSEKDVKMVFENHKKYGIPLDAVFLDIDYMKDFRDFTYDEQKFSDFKGTVQMLKDNNVHVVPIIDAGIKADKDNDPVDKEGLEKGYFCKKKDGTVFEAGVWPGLSHFTDFLNPEARKWFGEKYKMFLDAGIEGFWNDMNEPALFYSKDGLKVLFEKIQNVMQDKNNCFATWAIKDEVLKVQNKMEDYQSFYHRVPLELAGNFGECVVDGKVLVRHDLVHNLYGYNMTRAASEFFSSYSKDKKILMFSRASFVGAHRYGGIWTGDNASWWSHILLCIKQLPSMNMCGFLYSGCDLGGFGCNTSRELLLRFLALGVFTPLMRDHTACGTRPQETYSFENPEDFKAIVSLKYRLLPYLYSQFIDCANNNKMYFRPLAFDYQNDDLALNTEDQLMVGDSLMIAPIYTQNATGRTVYLPEDMTCVYCRAEDGSCIDSMPERQLMERGVHYIKCDQNEVVFFIKKDKKIPVVKAALNTQELNLDEKEWW